MRQKAFRGMTSLSLLFAATALYGQGGAGSNTILVISIVIITVLVLVGVLLSVTDNLLVIEAKQNGTIKSGANFSIFPRWSEIFPPRVPEYVEKGSLRVLKKGHNILLKGEAEPVIDEEVKARTYGLQPPNFIGLSPIPKVVVEEGAIVKAGDPIYFDKKHPEIQHVAPVSGEVISVNRGAKRAIVEVVILADKEMQYRELPAFDLEKGSREELVQYLLVYGGWPLIRQRPFNVLPDPEEMPANIFISTFDTAPLAPDLNLVVEGKGDAFQKGIDVLNCLTEGKVHLGLDARTDKAPSTVFSGVKGAELHYFRGKHPAGNVGIQIHHIDPIIGGKKVWTLGVQEVITLGMMFLERKYHAERVVAITGAELKEPRYVRTYLGANIGDLIKENLKHDHVRIISGDVLSGEEKKLESFVNFHDDQITVVKEGDYFEMFGWLIPNKLRPTVSLSYPTPLLKGMRFRADTNTHGEPRAFVVTGQYEKLLPMDIFPQHLMKAILVNDFERMEGLGINELVEEDIALCEFACTSKQPLQEILREGLEIMREQG